MNYYSIEPQVPGSIWTRSELRLTGPTEFENEIITFVFSFNHRSVDTIDDIFTSEPYYFVSRKAKDLLTAIAATGCAFEPIANVYQDTDEVIPGEYYRMDVCGVKGVDDIYEDPGDLLVCVSDKVRDAIRHLRLNDCPITPR